MLGDVPNIVIVTPDDESEDDTYTALINSESKSNDDTMDNRSFNNLAPDDVTSIVGSR